MPATRNADELSLVFRDTGGLGLTSVGGGPMSPEFDHEGLDVLVQSRELLGEPGHVTSIRK